MTNHCVTYRVNNTARVDDDNVGNDVGDSDVARAIKPMSYRALIISTTRASDPRIPTKIYALCSIDYKEIIDWSFPYPRRRIGRGLAITRHCVYYMSLPSSPHFIPLAADLRSESTCSVVWNKTWALRRVAILEKFCKLSQFMPNLNSVNYTVLIIKPTNETKSCTKDWKNSVYDFLLKEFFLSQGQDKRREILSCVKVHTSSDFSYPSTLWSILSIPEGDSISLGSDFRSTCGWRAPSFYGK